MSVAISRTVEEEITMCRHATHIDWVIDIEIFSTYMSLFLNGCLEGHAFFGSFDLFTTVIRKMLLLTIVRCPSKNDNVLLLKLNDYLED